VTTSGRIALFRFRDPQRDVALAGVAQSRSMNQDSCRNSKAVRTVRGRIFRNSASTAWSTLKIPAELKKYRAEPPSAFQAFQPVPRNAQEILRIFQALDVGQNLVGFDREVKVLRRFRDPILDGCLFGRVAENCSLLRPHSTRCVVVQGMFFCASFSG